MKRFTQRARRVLSLAQDEAEQLRHNYIGTEHLLIALMREEDSIAGRVLRDLGVEQSRVEELVERLTQASTHTAQVPIDLSPDTKKMLEHAVDEARRMGHTYIGTEHLLLGLVRQSEGVAINVLKRLSISPEEIRRQTHRVLQERPEKRLSRSTIQVDVVMDVLERLGVRQEIRRHVERALEETSGRKAVQAWEYLVVFISDSDITDEESIAAFAGADHYTEKLNTYGKDGWELFSFHWTDNGGRAILKRPGYF